MLKLTKYDKEGLDLAKVFTGDFPGQLAHILTFNHCHTKAVTVASNLTDIQRSLTPSSQTYVFVYIQCFNQFFEGVTL